MAKEPDSEAFGVEGFSVHDTSARDQPEFGSVQVRIDHNEHQSSTWSMTLDDARLLRGALTDYINSKEGN